MNSQAPQSRLTGGRSRRVGRASWSTGTAEASQRLGWSFVGAVAVAVAVLGGGLWLAARARGFVHEALRDRLALVADTSAVSLGAWLERESAGVGAVAARLGVVAAVADLLEVPTAERAGLGWSDELTRESRQVLLRHDLDALARASGARGWVVAAPTGRVLAASADEQAGAPVNLPGPALERLADGTLEFVRPFLSPSGAAVMGFAAPVRLSGRLLASVILLHDPGERFSAILREARLGESGETYAFDADGRMLSDSRFGAQLQAAGLLPADEPRTALRLVLRDPGVNLTDGSPPPGDLARRPLVRPLRGIAQAPSGADVDGYADYRGVNVVGGWVWLDRFEIGVLTEIDRDEAYALPNLILGSVWGLLGLLVIASLAGAVVVRLAANLRARAARASELVRQLGQYSLGKKLGEGGMGAVYEARHALLRRRTAVKLLDPRKDGERDPEVALQLMARFEREVQATSELSHPNTIAVYDFGRTPDGIFYYAMEYLDGVDLETLVEREGPLPPARVVMLVRQICGALAEAHDRGLIHRDVKPANVFVCRRGGLFDFVKVLDFGLVKDATRSDTTSAALTATHSITGTPLYMSPEAIQDSSSVTGQSDLYAVGAVMYFLLAGRPVFLDDNIMQLCVAHMTRAPDDLASVCPSPLSAELRDAVMRCLEKAPSARFADARALEEALAAAPEADQWTQREAAAFWRQRGDALSASAAAEAPAASGVTALGTAPTIVSDRVPHVGRAREDAS